MRSLLNSPTKRLRRVCVLSNMHGFFHYLLLSSVCDIEQTYFFWNVVGFSNEIRSHFKGMESPVPKLFKKTSPKILNTLLRNLWLFYNYRILFPIKWPFLLKSTIEYWGQINVNLSNCIYRNHSFKMVEDGFFNYGPYPYEQKRFSVFGSFIKRLIGGPLCAEYRDYFGSEDQCVEINLTGLLNDGEVLKSSKIKVESFEQLWNKSNNAKREYINNIMGLNNEFLISCKRYKRLLLTQPLSEDNIVTEDQKIAIYSNLVMKIGRNDLVIKPHPRDTTDYSKLFPEIPLLKTQAPIELLSLNNVRFEYVYAISSTAIFDFPYKVKACYFGSKIHPILKQKHPEWSIEKLHINNKNIELVKL